MVSGGNMVDEACEDIKAADKGVKERSQVCDECVKAGTKWVQLRVCLTCGNVGCCDSSPGRHATKHFNDTKHPVMAAFPGREWLWCYVHKSYG